MSDYYQQNYARKTYSNQNNNSNNSATSTYRTDRSRYDDRFSNVNSNSTRNNYQNYSPAKSNMNTPQGYHQSNYNSNNINGQLESDYEQRYTSTSRSPPAGGQNQGSVSNRIPLGEIVQNIQTRRQESLNSTGYEENQRPHSLDSRSQQQQQQQPYKYLHNNPQPSSNTQKQSNSSGFFFGTSNNTNRTSRNTFSQRDSQQYSHSSISNINPPNSRNQQLQPLTPSTQSQAYLPARYNSSSNNNNSLLNTPTSHGRLDTQTRTRSAFSPVAEEDPDINTDMNSTHSGSNRYVVSSLSVASTIHQPDEQFHASHNSTRRSQQLKSSHRRQLSTGAAAATVTPPNHVSPQLSVIKLQKVYCEGQNNPNQSSNNSDSTQYEQQYKGQSNPATPQDTLKSHYNHHRVLVPRGQQNIIAGNSRSRTTENSPNQSEYSEVSYNNTKRLPAMNSINRSMDFEYQQQQQQQKQGARLTHISGMTSAQLKELEQQTLSERYVIETVNNEIITEKTLIASNAFHSNPNNFNRATNIAEKHSLSSTQKNANTDSTKSLNDRFRFEIKNPTLTSFNYKPALRHDISSKIIIEHQENQRLLHEQSLQQQSPAVDQQYNRQNIDQEYPQPSKKIIQQQQQKEEDQQLEPQYEQKAQEYQEKAEEQQQIIPSNSKFHLMDTRIQSQESRKIIKVDGITSRNESELREKSVENKSIMHSPSSQKTILQLNELKFKLKQSQLSRSNQKEHPTNRSNPPQQQQQESNRSQRNEFLNLSNLDSQQPSRTQQQQPSIQGSQQFCQTTTQRSRILDSFDNQIRQPDLSQSYQELTQRQPQQQLPDEIIQNQSNLSSNTNTFSQQQQLSKATRDQFSISQEGWVSLRQNQKIGSSNNNNNTSEMTKKPEEHNQEDKDNNQSGEDTQKQEQESQQEQTLPQISQNKNRQNFSRLPLPNKSSIFLMNSSKVSAKSNNSSSSSDSTNNNNNIPSLKTRDSSGMKGSQLATSIIVASGTKRTTTTKQPKKTNAILVQEAYQIPPDQQRQSKVQRRISITTPVLQGVTPTAAATTTTTTTISQTNTNEANQIGSSESEIDNRSSLTKRLVHGAFLPNQQINKFDAQSDDSQEHFEEIGTNHNHQKNPSLLKQSTAQMSQSHLTTNSMLLPHNHNRSVKNSQIREVSRGQADQRPTTGTASSTEDPQEQSQRTNLPSNSEKPTSDAPSSNEISQRLPKRSLQLQQQQLDSFDRPNNDTLRDHQIASQRDANLKQQFDSSNETATASATSATNSLQVSKIMQKQPISYLQQQLNNNNNMYEQQQQSQQQPQAPSSYILMQPIVIMPPNQSKQSSQSSSEPYPQKQQQHPPHLFLGNHQHALIYQQQQQQQQQSPSQSAAAHTSLNQFGLSYASPQKLVVQSPSILENKSQMLFTNNSQNEDGFIKSPQQLSSKQQTHGNRMKKNISRESTTITTAGLLGGSIPNCSNTPSTNQTRISFIPQLPRLQHQQSDSKQNNSNQVPFTATPAPPSASTTNNTSTSSNTANRRNKNLRSISTIECHTSPPPKSAILLPNIKNHQQQQHQQQQQQQAYLLSNQKNTMIQLTALENSLNGNNNNNNNNNSSSTQSLTQSLNLSGNQINLQQKPSRQSPLAAAAAATGMKEFVAKGRRNSSNMSIPGGIRPLGFGSSSIESSTDLHDMLHDDPLVMKINPAHVGYARFYQQTKSSAARYNRSPSRQRSTSNANSSNNNNSSSSNINHNNPFNSFQKSYDHQDLKKQQSQHHHRTLSKYEESKLTVTLSKKPPLGTTTGFSAYTNSSQSFQSPTKFATPSSQTMISADEDEQQQQQQQLITINSAYPYLLNLTFTEEQVRAIIENLLGTDQPQQQQQKPHLLFPLSTPQPEYASLTIDNLILTKFELSSDLCQYIVYSSNQIPLGQISVIHHPQIQQTPLPWIFTGCHAHSISDPNSITLFGHANSSHANDLPKCDFNFTFFPDSSISSNKPTSVAATALERLIKSVCLSSLPFSKQNKFNLNSEANNNNNNNNTTTIHLANSTLFWETPTSEISLESFISNPTFALSDRNLLRMLGEGLSELDQLHGIAMYPNQVTLKNLVFSANSPLHLRFHHTQANVKLSRSTSIHSDLMQLAHAILALKFNRGNEQIDSSNAKTVFLATWRTSIEAAKAQQQQQSTAAQSDLSLAAQICDILDEILSLPLNSSSNSQERSAKSFLDQCQQITENDYSDESTIQSNATQVQATLQDVTIMSSAYAIIGNGAMCFELNKQILETLKLIHGKTSPTYLCRLVEVAFMSLDLQCAESDATHMQNVQNIWHLALNDVQSETHALKSIAVTSQPAVAFKFLLVGAFEMLVQKKFDKAVHFLQAADAVPGTQLADTLQINTDIAIILHGINANAQAITHLQTATKAAGMLEITNSSLELALPYLLLGLVSEDVKQLEKSLEIKIRHGEQQSRIFNVMFKIGEIYLRKREFEAGQAAFTSYIQKVTVTAPSSLIKKNPAKSYKSSTSVSQKPSNSSSTECKVTKAELFQAKLNWYLCTIGKESTLGGSANLPTIVNELTQLCFDELQDMEGRTKFFTLLEIAGFLADFKVHPNLIEPIYSHCKQIAVLLADSTLLAQINEKSIIH